MSYEFKKLNMQGANVLYCPDYFEEHKFWYQMIDESVDWQQFNVRVHGKVIPQPRESFYMADNGYPYKYSGFDRKPEKWEVAVQEMRKALEKLLKNVSRGHPKLNAVLGNKYNDGKQYIGYHSDDEGDLHPDAFIVSVSLGAERDFVFKHKKTGETVSVPLKSGSIVLMGGDCQKNWKHSVPKRMRVKEPRINLTFRSVLMRE